MEDKSSKTVHTKAVHSEIKQVNLDVVQSKSEVTLFMGSHRSAGNTAYWLHALTQKLDTLGISYNHFDVNRLNINPCIDCDVCKNHWGKCVHADDMTMVYEALQCSKVVLFASPVYFNGLTSKLKTLVDRCQMIFLCDFGHQKPFVDSLDILAKKGYIVSVGGARDYQNQFVGSELSLKLVFDNLRIPLTEHIKYSNSDRYSLKEIDGVSADVERIAQAIYREVTAIER